MTADILIIEDEPNIAEAIRYILTREGWRPEFHPDGQGGIEAIRRLRPRLIILDLMLPNRSGNEILSELRAEVDDELARTPVLMLTARGKIDEATSQADALMAKPFANDELCVLVRKMLTGDAGVDHG